MPDHHPTASDLRRRTLEVLRNVIAEENSFVKIHAAEAMIDLDASDGLASVFRDEERAQGEKPAYRLGLWRVLTRTAATPADREPWLAKLRVAALDEHGPDRIGAVESLAKLTYRIAPADRSAFESAAGSANEGLALFARWALAVSGLGDQQDAIAQGLASTDPVSRLRAGFILRHLPNLSAANRAALFQAARVENPGTNTHAYLTASAALVAHRDEAKDDTAHFQTELRRTIEVRDAGERQEAIRAFSTLGAASDLPWIAPYLDDPTPGTRVASALVCGQILARQTTLA